RVVRGMSTQSTERLLAERRKERFISVDDFKRRARLAKDELRALAGVGALNCFGGHRRDALWEVEKEIYADDLFEHPGSAGVSPARSCDRSFTNSPGRRQRSQGTSPLAPMAYAERIRADYNGMGLTTGSHPMGLVRDRLKGIWRAADLP